MFYLDVSKVDLALHIFFYYSVAHVAMAPGIITALLARRALPSSPSPSLPSISLPWQFELGGKPYPTSAQTPREEVASSGPDGGTMPVW
jgi:hypothetical protein